MTHKYYTPILAMLSLSALAVAPMTAHAQKKLPRVSVYLRDVPVRTALQQVFNKAGIQHSVDSQITGYVTMRIRNQPVDTAVRLILRSATTPIAYTKENNVYIVKARPVAPVITNPTNIASNEEPQPISPEVNPYAYYDPYAFAIPLPRNPIVMGVPGMNVPANGAPSFGAGGVNGYIGVGYPGFGGFYNPYLNPYWAGLGQYYWPTGFNFGGLNAGNTGTFGSFGVLNGSNFGNFGGGDFGLRR